LSQEVVLSATWVTAAEQGQARLCWQCLIGRWLVLIVIWKPRFCHPVVTMLADSTCPGLASRNGTALM